MSGSHEKQFSISHAAPFLKGKFLIAVKANSYQLPVMKANGPFSSNGQPRTLCRVAAPCLLAVLGWALATPIQAQFLYSTNDNGSLTITGYSGTDATVVIPGTINVGGTDRLVTAVGDSAFYMNHGLTNVTIPDSVLSIGADGFGWCENLSSVTIGTGVTNIGLLAFEVCTRLGTLAIPDSVVTLGDGAFYSCSSLTGISLGARVTGIGESTFSGCYYLTNLAIPDSVTSIGDSAFYRCNFLTDIRIGRGVTNISGWAFSRCSRLANVVISDSVTCLGESAFVWCNSLTNVSIGAGVTSIPAGAFSLCYSLPTVTIPTGVTSIGSQAFGSCGALTNVIVGPSVIAIDDQAFAGCSSLTGLYFQGNAPSPMAPKDPANNTTVYYLPGTTGWGPTYGGWPTAPWVLPYPLILTTGPNFGIRTNQFVFTISWATNATVVVEACTNVANPAWSGVSTNPLSNGFTCFTDPDWTAYPARFYRVRSP
jgi:hypothetical protein